MWTCIGIIIAAAIILVFYVIEKIRGYSVKSVLIKTIVSLLFVAVAIYSSWTNGGHFLNTFVIAGLLLGLTGDVWLDLKYVYPKDDKIYTYSGFLVFGIGHILFITGMFLEFYGNATPWHVVIPLLVAPIFGLITICSAKILKLDYKDMKWVAFSYAIVLFANPLCSLSLLIANGWQNTTLVMLFIGGIIFVLSDLVLSGTYFGEGHEKPLDFILNYLFYYSAQFIIAFSLFFL